MESIKDIIYKIDNNNFSDDEKIEAINKLVVLQNKEAIPYFVSLLSSKNISWIVRDALALSLSDLYANEAVPIIIDLIQLPENINRRGTLLYSLLNLDASKYFLYFTELLCTANFECRQMAELLIEKFATQTTIEIRQEALVILKTYEAHYQKNEEENFLDFIKATESLLIGIQ